jgi:DNA-binding CsgD family transcriptional regulator
MPLLPSWDACTSYRRESRHLSWGCGPGPDGGWPFTRPPCAVRAPAQLGSLLLDVHALTPAQQRVTALVLQGRSTREIVSELHLSPHTVQEYVRAAYDKFGVGSRRELIAALLGQHWVS